MTKQTFMKGAMILLAAGIVTRILGFVPRIALPRLIGSEGVGLYQQGYPFLIVMLTLITGGIPLAVSKQTSEALALGDERRVRHIFRTAMTLTIGLALACTGLMLLLAPWITTHLLPDARVYRSFLFMTPMLGIIAVSSVYRGYFQGRHNMLPTAYSQIAETVLRIVFVLFFARWMLPWGLEWAAAGAMLGGVIGELGGLAVLLGHRMIERRRETGRPTALPSASGGRAEPPVLGGLLRLSVPVTFSKLVGSLSYLLESIFIARALVAAGVATALATSQYGELQGMIIPIVLLPTALTYSLSVSLVPSLSEAAARGDHAIIRKRLHQSIRLALVSGAPFVVAMLLLAEPICRLLFHHAEIAPMLQLMAPLALFIYLQSPLQAALQALDKPGVALRNTFFGACVKLILIAQLASNPALGIYGALLAINANIMLVTVLHYFSVAKSTGYRFKLPDLGKVAAAMLIMGAALRWCFTSLPLDAEWLRAGIAFSGALAVYLLLMVIMRIIDRHDVSRLPLIGRWFG
ncbi:stage V sporulation protein B [Paenibacillus sp. IB182496]|uniref:Stage V sporulation protein B n=1 Tax=Paenibacillus sabuli TaxID=2772509 RepID=A0A927GR53_9BACL|nr:stage V sporulation protein B [Paenibacillus sabuli]MBD2844575.1 stage V sporulation protein B [Paenibacillus sabuli]